MSNWQAIALPPSVTSGAFSADTMLLLTDGTIFVHNAYKAEWLRFTPDPKNGYAGGAWTLPDGSNSESDMTNTRQFFSSGVLQDGRVYAIGGEYSSVGGDTPQGEVYDPGSNSWTVLTALDKPASVSFVDGDACSMVLFDGRILFGGATGGSQTAIWSPASSTWVVAGTAFGTKANTKQGSTDEESWTLLADGSVLTVNISIGGQQSPTSAERYIPAQDTWVTTGALPVTLPLTTVQDTTTTPPTAVSVFEIGPAMLRNDGKAIAFGANGLTAIYDLATDTWTQGPNFPADPGDPSNSNKVLCPTGFLSLSDSPGVTQTNGRMLATAGTLYKNAGPPADFFSKNLKVCEYDPVAETIVQLADQPPSGVTSQDTWTSRFLILPTGQILLSTQQSQVYIYTPPSSEGSYQAAWKPVITTFPSTLIIGHSYLLTGTNLNGLSQANSYGDDAQMPTNYPIVQITDTTSGAVYYLKTQDFSSRGVAVPGTVTASVTVPRTTPPGAYNLVAIANGIPSDPIVVEIGTQDISFLLQEPEFGGGQIAAQINLAGAPAVYQAALFVAIEGYKLSDLGITNVASLADPGNQPTVHSSDSRITYAYSGAAEPEDITFSGPQQVLFPFQVSFTDDSLFTDPTLFPPGQQTAFITISATFHPPTGSPLTAIARIKLIQTPNPFLLHNDTTSTDPTVQQAWYLSTDLRVFQIEAGQHRFGASPANSGDAVADATKYIAKVISNLNADPAVADGLFEGIQENEDTAALNLAPTDGSNPIYNFALARVRTQDTAAATDVRVFFRMWAAQQTNATYDSSTTYASRTKGANRIPVLGVQNDEIVTIPFFATPRVSVGASTTMADQTDPPNVQASIGPDPLGAEVHRYFGCWLDINQPGSDVFPAFVQGNAAGPFTGDGPLVSIQSFARSDHQCLIAEISYLPDPPAEGSDPSTSNKLAQRNLTFVNVPNPGFQASRVVPQTFEIKPSPAVLLRDGRPDELVIHWGSLPAGSTAQIYLPAVSSAEIIALADRLYLTHRLTALDAHTIQTPVGTVGYVPIPQGSVVNYAGLLSIDLPVGIKKGEKFDVTIRQVTSTGIQAVGITGNIPSEEAESAASDRSFHTWRRVTGQFNITIPVSTKGELLPKEEERLSIMKWIGESIPKKSRWWLVFQRYLEQLGGRVTHMGGDPGKVYPSPTGGWRHPYPGEGGHGGHGEGGGRGGHGEGHDGGGFDGGGDGDWGGVTGKIDAVIYDHFGDFAGFVLEDFRGRMHRFHSKEHRVEVCVRRAKEERLVTTVVAGDKGEVVLEVIVR
jgi:Kelch motif